MEIFQKTVYIIKKISNLKKKFSKNKIWRNFMKENYENEN